MGMGFAPTWLRQVRFRFDVESTGVRRAFDCLTEVIRCTVT